jgi:hypothetical protein
MGLDGTQSEMQHLRDLGVRTAVGGQRGDPALAASGAAAIRAARPGLAGRVVRPPRARRPTGRRLPPEGCRPGSSPADPPAAPAAAAGCPHRIEARVTTADGRTTTKDLILDQGVVQQRAFRFGDVTAVRFVLRSAYGAAANKQVAIAEIEFFGPFSGNGS